MQSDKPLKFDYIVTMECCSKEYSPQYEQFTNEEHDHSHPTLQLSDLKPIYLNQYANSYYEYKIKEEDTLYGLELKFNISESEILEINEITEDCFYPGMKIKLPISKVEDQLQEVSPLKQKRQNSFLGVNLMDELMQHRDTKTIKVFYLTDLGNFEGDLTITDDMLFFCPFDNEHNLNLVQDHHHLLKLQLSVHLQDLHSTLVVNLPKRISTQKEESSTDILLQLMVYRLGKKPFEEKYMHKLIKMKKHKKPIASVFFRLVDHEGVLDEEKQIICIQEIANQIQSRLEKLDIQDQIPDQENITSIPYFDVIRENIQNDELMLKVLMGRTNSIWGASECIPIMKDKSNMITSDHLIDIISHIPSLFHIGEWKLIYSTIKHGSLLKTLMRNCEDHSPLIIIIKDLDAYIFGAYLSEKLKYSSQFYGNGETFVFTFQNTKHCTTFKWTRINSDFILSDQDGLSVGCGDKFGLYINDELSGGYTTTCETFANDQLSKNKDFIVDQIEVWTLDL